MGKRKLKDLKTEKKVITALALGKPQKEIAKEVGVSQQAISAFKNRDDIKPLLEKQIFRLVELAPDAMDNVQEVVKDKIKKIPKNDIKRREFVTQTSIEVLKGVAVLPSNIQNQTIINLSQNNCILTPRVLELLRAHEKAFEWHDEDDDKLKPDFTEDPTVIDAKKVEPDTK